MKMSELFGIFSLWEAFETNQNLETAAVLGDE